MPVELATRSAQRLLVEIGYLCELSSDEKSQVEVLARCKKSLIGILYAEECPGGEADCPPKDPGPIPPPPE